MKLDLVDIFTKKKKKAQMSSFIKLHPCGQTDMTKLIVAFRNYANALKKRVSLYVNNGVLVSVYVRVYAHAALGRVHTNYVALLGVSWVSCGLDRGSPTHGLHAATFVN
jgi:hypothetical protein